MLLSKVLKESFNVHEAGLPDDTPLASFGEWDSMSHMFFITKLEECYSIELTGDEIADMKTVGDVKQVIISRGKTL